MRMTRANTPDGDVAVRGHGPTPRCIEPACGMLTATGSCKDKATKNPDILLGYRGFILAGAGFELATFRLLAGRSAFAVHGQIYVDAGREADPVRCIDTSSRQLF